MLKKILILIFIGFLVYNCNNPKNVEKINSQKVYYKSNLKQKYKNKIILNEHDHSYNGSLLFGKSFSFIDKKFKNSDIFNNSKCFLFENNLYLIINNENRFNPTSIYIKFETNKPNIIFLFSSDFGENYLIKPNSYILNLSSSQYQIGDTIVGDLTCMIDDEQIKYNCEGYFFGIIENETPENIYKLIYSPKGEKIFK